MVVLRAVLIALEGLLSLMLIGIILLQKSKSEGLGLAFGAGAGEALFGSRAGTILTKATVVLALLFMGNTILLANLFTGGGSASLMQQYSETAPPPAAPAAQAPAPGPAASGAVAPTLPGADLDDAPAQPPETASE